MTNSFPCKHSIQEYCHLCFSGENTDPMKIEQHKYNYCYNCGIILSNDNKYCQTCAGLSTQFNALNIQLTPIKYDSDKPPVSMIPRVAIEGEAKALGYGAKKYGRDNYKKGEGMEWTRLIDAAMRHLLAFSDKESFDKESGLCHLYHARASLAMLCYYFETKTGKDDRRDL